MAQLPSDPPPSSVEIIGSGFGVKSRSANKTRSQARRAARFYLGFKVSYRLLDFDQRNEILAFLFENDGTVGTFETLIPTFSENTALNSYTATPDQSYSAGDSQITLTGLSGQFKKMDLIKISGSSNVYLVTSAGTPSGGSQQVTIRPRLLEDVTTATVFETKDVPVTVSINAEEINSPSEGMSSSISFELIEEVS